MSYRSLNAESISKTIELLCRRVETRFPDSGFSRVCREAAMAEAAPPAAEAGPPGGGQEHSTSAGAVEG